MTNEEAVALDRRINDLRNEPRDEDELPLDEASLADLMAFLERTEARRPMVSMRCNGALSAHWPMPDGRSVHVQFWGRGNADVRFHNVKKPLLG